MPFPSQWIHRAFARASMLAAALLVFHPVLAAADPLRSANADITGVVTDAGSGQPLPSAEVSVMSGTQVVSNASTDAFGRYTAHNIAPGTYTVTARFLGFSPESKTITVGDSNADIRVDFSLNAVAINLQGVTVTASVPLAVDTRTGDQRDVARHERQYARRQEGKQAGNERGDRRIAGHKAFRYFTAARSTGTRRTAISMKPTGATSYRFAGNKVIFSDFPVNR